MPDIKVLSRSVGDRKGYHRNFSPHEHRFARGREYIRAVRAAKLERLHAKPFVAAFDGHVETVCKLVKVRNKLPTMISADWDGEIRCWDMAQHLLNWRVRAHRGRVMGLTTTNTGTRSVTPINSNSNSNSNSSSSSNNSNNTNEAGALIANGQNLVISTGIDKTIKIWKLHVEGAARKINVRDDVSGWEGLDQNNDDLDGMDGNLNGMDAKASGSDQLPVQTINHWEPLHCVDACWQERSTLFATGASSVKLWDINRSHEIHEFKGTVDQVVCMSFNPSQYDILATGMQDRKLTFYDTRTKTPLPFISLLNWCNEIKFNPIDPRLFVVASNDTCLYTFDMRNLRSALRTHRGHIDSVMSVDWSPLGKEFASGSMDGHIRVWNSAHEGKDSGVGHTGKQIGYSRELYKAKRMYNIYQVRWSWDNKYIVSGSADGALRLWKSHRSLPLKRINQRQKQALQYSQRLKEKYAHMSEVGVIWKFRKAKLPHRIPRNGVYFKKERYEQKKYKDLKNKVKIYGDSRKDYKNQWNRLRKKQKKNGSWAKQVVEKSGTVHENVE